MLHFVVTSRISVLVPETVIHGTTDGRARLKDCHSVSVYIAAAIFSRAILAVDPARCRLCCVAELVTESAYPRLWLKRLFKWLTLNRFALIFLFFPRPTRMDDSISRLVSARELTDVQYRNVIIL
jgi:hypothetical protein